MSIMSGLGRRVRTGGGSLPYGEATADQTRQALTGVVGVPVNAGGAQPVMYPKPAYKPPAPAYQAGMSEQDIVDVFSEAVRSQPNNMLTYGAAVNPFDISTPEDAAALTKRLIDANIPIIGGGDGVAPSTPTPSTAGGGGGGSAAPQYDLTALANYVNQQLADVGALYGGYGTQLEEQRAAAAQRIADANAAALARLQSSDPMAGFQYQVQPSVQPMAGGVDYLRAIGAPTTQVDAARQLGQQLMAGQMQSAQDFANQVAAAQEADRLARIAAVESAGLQGVSGLESAAAAMQAQIRQAQLAEERRLQELLLEAQLKYGV